MIVEVDLEVFNDSEPSFDLWAVFRQFRIGRHSWFVSDPEAIRRSKWFSMEGMVRRRQIEQLLVSSERNRRPKLHVRMETRPGTPWTLSVSDAAWWLGLGVKVLVENASADGRLVELSLLRVGERVLRRRLGAARAEEVRKSWTQGRGVSGWFELEHGGGSTLADRAQAFAGERIPPVLLVIVDSDRRWPGAQLGKTARDALAVTGATERPPGALLEGWKPEVVVLEQREVENYIPDEALRARSGRNRACQALFALSAIQRQHFDHKDGLRHEIVMKKGIAPSDEADTWVWREPQVRSLYSSARDVTALMQGFGPDVWRCLLDDDHIHTRGLRERSGNELDRLAVRILDMV